MFGSVTFTSSSVPTSQFAHQYSPSPKSRRGAKTQGRGTREAKHDAPLSSLNRKYKTLHAPILCSFIVFTPSSSTYRVPPASKRHTSNSSSLLTTGISLSPVPGFPDENCWRAERVDDLMSGNVEVRGSWMNMAVRCALIISWISEGAT